ncbi:MAG: hypothetical protein LC795_16300 [Acidobacteria bacterium]|nr:hypothetical protein [Acidobacteriota bacterium]
MDELKIATIDLAEVAGLSHEERLEKMYDWRFADSAERGKIFFGTALSNLVALLSELLKDDKDSNPELAAVVAVVALANLVIGWLYFRHSRETSDGYVEGLRLFSDAAAGGVAFRRLLRTFYGGRP